MPVTRRGGWSVDFGPEWERVIAALAKANVEIPKDLDNRIKREAEMLADRARANALALPTPSNAGHTGLRARVAAGVAVKAATLGNVQITTSMPEKSEAFIPRGLDRGAKGWRHPVFGNKNNWVTQPGYSWFTEEMQSGHSRLEAAATDVLEDAVNRIADAGAKNI